MRLKPVVCWALLALLLLCGCGMLEELQATQAPATLSGAVAVEADGTYTDRDHVALYIHTYHKLPSNYLTKKEAEQRGWNSSHSTMAEALPGYSIGGDHFGNHEQLLPTIKGRRYFECDIDYKSGHRNAKRIIYSDDGLIYYTDDHYKTFTEITFD